MRHIYTRRNILTGLIISFILVGGLVILAILSSERYKVILIPLLLLILLALFWKLYRDFLAKKEFNEELNRQVQEKMAAIKTSEERYRQIVETAHEGIWMIDKNDNTSFVNERMSQMLGYSRQEMTGRPLFDFLDESGRKLALKNLQQRRKGIPEGQEFRFQTKEGKVLWALVSSTPILIDGEYNGALAMVMDITERKKAHDDIRRSNESFQLISRTTNDAVWEWDLEANQLWANENNQRLYGLTVNDPVPTENMWAERLHPEERETIVQRQKETLGSDKNVFISEYRFNTAEHGYRDIYDRCYIVRNKEGKPIRMTGSMMDITQRKIAEEQIVKEKHLSDTAINSLPGIFYMFDINRRFLRWNTNYETVSGYNKEELPNITPTDFFAEEDREYARQKVEEIFQKGSAELEARFLTKDGRKIPYFFTGRAIMYDGVPCMLGTGIDISELKRAQQEIVETNSVIVESENRLRTIINSEPQCIKLLDREGILLDINPAGLAMIEADSLDMVKGKYVVHMVDEDYREPFVKLIDEVFDDKPGTLQFTITGIKGTKRWLETHAVPMKNASGDIISLLGVTMDITARKKAEEELKRNEEKYRTLVEQAVDAIALYDQHGRILDVNTGSARLLGYSKEELMQMSLNDVLTPEEIIHKPVRYDILQTGESTVKQRQMRKKDGTTVETEVRSQQLPDGRFLSVIRDLSERIKSQQLIEEEKRLSDKLIDSMPGVFYWYDEKGHFLRWNRELESVSGYSTAEVAQMNPIDFFEGETKLYIEERIAAVFRDGSADAEAYFVAKDGSKRPYYFNAVRFNYKNQSCLLGTGIDISDRKKAEDELEASNETLRKLTEHLQNIREEERSHIAREIHDELGQQLTVLKMDISWLNKKMVTEDVKIRDRMKELMSMIDTTVRSVRKISSELRPSMLDDLGLPAALEWQGQEFEKRSGIKVNTSMEVSDIRLPNNIAITLFRIFQESLTNVARHSQATDVMVRLKIDGQKLEMTISDNGKGFVVRGIENKKTLGILGMKERVTIINGEYSIDSAPGKGTKVKVSVPLNGME